MKWTSDKFKIKQKVKVRNNVPIQPKLNQTASISLTSLQRCDLQNKKNVRNC